MRRSAITTLATSLVLLLPAVASAHPGPAGHVHGGQAFAAGLGHPFTGLDHLLAMFAIGIWTIQLARVARWRVPVAFLAMMCVGGMLAALRVHLPAVESGILASVLIMGLVVFLAFQMRAGAAAALVGVFALFHGYAHLAEIPPGAPTASYAAGFILASAVIITAGASIARLLSVLRRPQWLRACGIATAAAAVVMLVLA